MDTQTEVVLLVIALGMSWVVGAVAASKGYERNIWALWGLLAWPIALLVLLAKPRNPSLFRRCPDCGSTDVPVDVPVCRHCGRDERALA